MHRTAATANPTPTHWRVLYVSWYMNLPTSVTSTIEPASQRAFARAIDANFSTSLNTIATTAYPSVPSASHFPEPAGESADLRRNAIDVASMQIIRMRSEENTSPDTVLWEATIL